MKYLKWFLVLISIGIAIISVTEIISYFRDPESYMLGSEAMTENGGLYYKSNLFFLLINLLQITFSILASILFFKAKGTIGGGDGNIFSIIANLDTFNHIIL